MSDIKFVNGIRIFSPHQNAPDFVKGTLLINKQELIEWLSEQGDEVRADIKESRQGKLYLAVNDYKPQHRADASASPGDDFDGDIPF